MRRYTPLRPPILLLTPACVAVGIAAAAAARAPVAPLEALLCLVGALLAHASVNAIDEHADVARGRSPTGARTRDDYPVSRSSGGNQPAGKGSSPLATAASHASWSSPGSSAR